jgi:hypothetical protein
VNQLYTKKDNPIVVFYSESTEPSVTSLGKWFDLIWRKHVTQFIPLVGLEAQTHIPFGNSSLLLWDSYDLHLQSQLKAKCDQLSILCETFPLGCACKLQPLNVFAKRTFLVRFPCANCLNLILKTMSSCTDTRYTYLYICL